MTLNERLCYYWGRLAQAKIDYHPEEEEYVMGAIAALTPYGEVELDEDIANEIFWEKEAQ